MKLSLFIILFGLSPTFAETNGNRKDIESLRSNYQEKNKKQHGKIIKNISTVDLKGSCFGFGQKYIVLKYQHNGQENELVSFHSSYRNCQEKLEWVQKQIESAKQNSKHLEIDTLLNENKKGKYFSITPVEKQELTRSRFSELNKAMNFKNQEHDIQNQKSYEAI